MLGTMVQDQLVEWIRTEIHARPGPAPFFLSVSGGQGVGKSYLTHGLLLKEFPNSIILSLDDYYLRKADRKALAQDVHPMLGTRGVPGTHDLGLLEKHLELLSTGEPCAFDMPIFDKIADDRSGYEHKQLENIELVIVEGWCLGAQPQTDSDLEEAINPLEKSQDATGEWRAYVNAQMTNMHRRLGAYFDRSVYLKPIDFDAVLGWRLEQERNNFAEQGKEMPAERADEIEEFVQYYQRISQQMIDQYQHFDFVIEVSGPKRDWSLLLSPK